MLDVSVSYNRYKFIGHEFLTWLWFLIEKNPDLLKQLNPDLVSLEIGNRVMLENSTRDSLETITIKGDDAGMEEGIMALIDTMFKQFITLRISNKKWNSEVLPLIKAWIHSA